MSPEQESFIKHVEENPLDDARHLVYADWLEEHDQPEEAERQRKFPAAAKWLCVLASRAGRTCTNYGDYRIDPVTHKFQRLSEEVWEPITYEILVQAGHDFVDSREHFVQMGDEWLRDNVIGETARLYWENWSIVTGRPIPKIEGLNEYYQGWVGPFSCSC